MNFSVAQPVEVTSTSFKTAGLLQAREFEQKTCHILQDYVNSDLILCFSTYDEEQETFNFRF